MEVFMKKSLLIVGAFAAVIVLSGCFATHTSDGAYMAQVKIEKSYTPIITHQNKPVTGTATINSLFGFITWGVSKFADDAFTNTKTNMPVQLAPNPLDVAKQGATYNACDTAKCDMLLNAKYTIEINDYIVFKQIKCKAVGYPGVVKGLK